MKNLLFFLLAIVTYSNGWSQNIGIGTAAPNASAMLEISSNNKGLLIPRLTSSQRNAIASPAKGLMAFDSSQNSFWYYNGSTWKEIAGNTYNADSMLVVGKQTGSITNYNLTANASASDSSGYLYDSGGPLGNYGNNENFVFQINVTGTEIATDIIVLNNNMESPYDSLTITDDFGHRYLLQGTTTGTYRIFGRVFVQFKTNFANTMAGFAIRWNGVYPSTNNNYDASQNTGWYYNPAKNYMRGGVNVNNRWNPDSSGLYSFAFGYNNKAFGNYSLSMGNVTSASGFASTAIGSNTIASGYYSTAMGVGTTASGDASIAMGSGTIANYSYCIAMGYGSKAGGLSSIAMGQNSIAFGDNSIAMGSYTNSSAGYSTAIGYHTTVSGAFSTALGSFTVANGNFATALGYQTEASGNYSAAMGYNIKSKSYGGLSIGFYNDSTNATSATSFNPLNRIFQIGIGTADNARSNAMTVLQNGNVGIGTTTPAALLDVNGNASFNDKSILLRNGGNPYHGLRYDSIVDGPYLFGYNGGALGTSGLPNSLNWDWNGNVSVHSNFTVQNGKGIIRSTDGTQKKQLSNNVLVNTSLAAGATTSINFTFSESFSSPPDAYVGNVVSGGGGWAEVILMVANVSTTGGTLYVHNTTNGTWNPNFTVKVIAIGPQ
jgi:hypothetical protein